MYTTKKKKLSYVLINLAQLVNIMHNICKVRFKPQPQKQNDHVIPSKKRKLHVISSN